MIINDGVVCGGLYNFIFGISRFVLLDLMRSYLSRGQYFYSEKESHVPMIFLITKNAGRHHLSVSLPGV